MSRFSALLLSLFFILFTFVFTLYPSPVQGANLLELRDVLSYPQTASVSAHNFYFSSPSTINDGFFRIQISDSFVFNSPIAVTGANVTGYTFSGGVATASSGYHNFEIHYSGSGTAGTSLNLTIDSLTNPNTQNAYAYILSQYDSSANLINQSTGRVSIHNNPTITAHIPDYSVSNPILISPSDFAITNNPYEPFSFTRSTSIPGVDYYDLYLDDQLVAGNIDHDLPSQEYYFFKTLRQNETIHILLKQPLSEGTHTWYIKAYGVSGSRKSATSGKRSFTVDSTYPQIILTSIDNQTLNWIVPDRTDIIVRSSNPFFKGKVEALSNLKLSLLCPAVNSPLSIVNCSDPSITIFEEDGNWEHRFHNLVPNHRYAVYLAATDKAGNSHIFPTFYITYVPYSIISYIFPTPTGTPPLPSPPSEGGERVGVSPTPTGTPPLPSPPSEGGERVGVSPPPSPSIPQEKFLPTPTSKPFIIPKSLFINLILFGLLFHLLLTYFGASVPIRQYPPFFWRLLFPFMTKSNRRTVMSKDLSLFPSPNLGEGRKGEVIQPLPFTTIYIFNPTNLHQKPYLYISNILGQFSLPSVMLNSVQHQSILNQVQDNSETSELVLLRLNRPGYTFKDQLINHQTLLAINELNLERKDSPSALERLQLLSLNLRWLPLLVANLTSLLLCYFATLSPITLVYLLISLLLTYSEYLYPHSQIIRA